MRAILWFALVMCLPALGADLTAEQQKEVDFHARRFRKQVEAEIRDGRMDTLARRTDLAIDGLVAKGLRELEAHGDHEGAYYHRFLYESQFRGYLSRLADGDRDIGDHRPLVQWLADFYDRLEFILGTAACKALHLSDIKTLNYTIPVVFHPCDFPMDAVTGSRQDEYKRHFAEGEVYYGLIPVICYWAVDLGCMAASSGVAAMLCGPVASAVEYGVGRFVAPKLSDFVFTRRCGDK